MNTVPAQPGANASKPRYANPFGHLGAVRRLVAPAVARPFAVVETVVFMLVVLAISWAFNHDDPLLLRSGYPWLWFAPLVVALRYGTLLGLLASVMMIGTWQVFAGAAGAAWPVLYFTGGVLQTIVAGHFGDTWASRTVRASAINDYLNDRLVAITNTHYLMRLSHERLEKDLLSKPTTLRDSITELRRLSVAHGLETPVGAHDADADVDPQREMPGAQELLQFVAQACQIEVAGLFAVHGGRVEREALARLGDAFDLDPHDELVKRVLETMAVSHVKSEDRPVANSKLLVCAPLIAADGQLLALLAIRRMPFLSLNFDNLQLLLVLLGYYADGVEHSQQVRDILEQVQGCPYEFALDMSRLTRLQRTSGIASSLVALTFPRDESGDSFFEHVMRRRRSLDLMWPMKTATHSVLVNLMPATDETGVDGYLARIEASLDAQFNLDLEGARVGVHTLHIGGMEPGPALQRLLKRSGVDV
ncbi:PelD GGDEF domain-containing protein [Paraburkholderia phosphatilytica]|uniref:PelD GGDEF domain-containing protein n=1 Tax=Paraburkholderia phosphatilytica TaxID=2282883 RepID=UPI000E4E6E0E|nr:PelD GGDEF domain-containing protein [Paraburkholderia phosphatilytica]